MGAMRLASSPLAPVFLQQQMERGACGHSTSARTSMSERSRLEEIEEVPPPAEEVGKVHVAVGKEVKEGKANLLWALENFSREKKIVIVHVHRPAQKIPMMGAWFPANQLKKSEVEAYWKFERDKMNEYLHEYLKICARFKVQAEKLVIETDDVGKGLVELITQHGITKLVMGAAADKYHSRKMKELKSKTALSVQQLADPSCKIWFVWRGRVISMRDAGVDESTTAQSPPASSRPTTSSESERLRSKSLAPGQSESSNMLTNIKQMVFWDRSRSAPFSSLGERTPAALAHEGLTERSSPVSSSGNGADPLEVISRNSEFASHSSGPMSEENGPLNSSSVHEPEENLHPPYSHHNLHDGGIDCEAYEQLQRVLTEAENSKREAYEEFRKRRMVERELYDTIRKVKAAEISYNKEVKQRKEIDERLGKERMELEKLKKQKDDISEELQKAHQQRMELEHQISDSDRMVKDFEENLSEAHHLLNSLRIEHEKLYKERDDAVREAEERHQKKAEGPSGTQGTTNYFSEFPYEELKQATLDFNDSLRIGEGGYGSVYKGFLRHTTVAIKMLNAQSMQGQSEFHQEVDILSRVRHPNLVTLVGACPEASALIYEFLPNGSLEDRLVCRDNTPPLSWQVRTRIAAEMCSALIFLHSNKPHSVVHGDLKPANILLDANFTSKLGDFGIGRLLVQSNSTTTPYCRTNPKGTFAYMDPEFLTSGELTAHSDVYSFGVIILRLLTGRPPLGINSKVREALEKECLDEILDGSAGGWPYVQAKQLAQLGLKCCEPKRKRRPNLAGEAWRVLEPMVKATYYSMGPSRLAFRPSAPDQDDNIIPSYFICPIFQEIMKDPCIAADGFTYEAEAIKGWLHSGHDTSPMTNRKLPHCELVPNHALRFAIQHWLNQ